MQQDDFSPSLILVLLPVWAWFSQFQEEREGGREGEMAAALAISRLVVRKEEEEEGGGGRRKEEEEGGRKEGNC